MALFGLLIGLIVAVLMGHLILHIIDPDKRLTILENISLSYLLGIGLLSVLLFWSSFIYLPYSVFIISALIFILFLIKTYKGQHFWIKSLFSRIKEIKINAKTVIWLLVFIIILIKLSYSFIEACSKPEYTWDAGCHWVTPGKIIYYLAKEEKSWIPNTLTKLHGHIAYYPKMIPYAHYWLFSWLGQANDQWSKIIFPLMLLAFTILFYSTVKIIKGSFEALLFSLLLLSAPFFIYHSTIGYGDFTLSIYFSTGIMFFYRWIKEKGSLPFWVFSLSLALTTWIKFEGKLLLVLGLMLLMMRLWLDKTQKRARLFQYLAAYAVIGLPWQLLLIFSRAPTYESIKFGLSWFVKNHLIMYQMLFNQGSWGLFWFIFVIASCFFFRKLFNRENIYLVLTMGLFYGILLFINLFTINYTAIDGTFNRHIIIIYPVAVLTIAVITPKIPWLKNGGKEDD